MINLVTGGMGFIGSYLIDKLLQLNEFVICIDNFSSGDKSNIKRWDLNNKFKFIEEDILEISSIKCDRIWHFACPASPKWYLIDPILTSRINFEGTLNLLKIAKENNSQFIFASSSEVYGSSLKMPQDEDNLGFIDTKSLKSCYSNGKRIAETLCFDFQRKFNLDLKVARIFNTYGPRMKIDDGRVISNLINQALNNQSLTIVGNGMQTRSFCYVTDTVDALIRLKDSKFRGAINIGSPCEISIIELAKLIDKKINFRRKFIFYDHLLDETIRRCPSLELASKIINWEPQINLDEGLDLSIKFYKDSL